MTRPSSFHARFRAGFVGRLAADSTVFVRANAQSGQLRRLVSGPLHHVGGSQPVTAVRPGTVGTPRWWHPSLRPAATGGVDLTGGADLTGAPAPTAPTSTTPQSSAAVRPVHASSPSARATVRRTPARPALPARTDLSGPVPARGLERVVRRVPDEKTWSPGSFSQSAAPKTIAMRLPAEVRAAGAMMTPQDGRRRSSAAPSPARPAAGNSPRVSTTPSSAGTGTAADSRARFRPVPASGGQPAGVRRWIRRRALAVQIVAARSEAATHSGSAPAVPARTGAPSAQSGHGLVRRSAARPAETPATSARLSSARVSSAGVSSAPIASASVSGAPGPLPRALPTGGGLLDRPVRRSVAPTAGAAHADGSASAPTTHTPDPSNAPDSSSSPVRRSLSLGPSGTVGTRSTGLAGPTGDTHGTGRSMAAAASPLTDVRSGPETTNRSVMPRLAGVRRSMSIGSIARGASLTAVGHLRAPAPAQTSARPTHAAPGSAQVAAGTVHAQGTGAATTASASSRSTTSPQLHSTSQGSSSAPRTALGGASPAVAAYSLGTSTGLRRMMGSGARVTGRALSAGATVNGSTMAGSAASARATTAATNRSFAGGDPTRMSTAALTSASTRMSSTRGASHSTGGPAGTSLTSSRGTRSAGMLRRALITGAPGTTPGRSTARHAAGLGHPDTPGVPGAQGAGWRRGTVRPAGAARSGGAARSSASPAHAPAASLLDTVARPIAQAPLRGWTRAAASGTAPSGTAHSAGTVGTTPAGGQAASPEGLGSLSAFRPAQPVVGARGDLRGGPGQVRRLWQPARPSAGPGGQFTVGSSAAPAALPALGGPAAPAAPAGPSPLAWASVRPSPGAGSHRARAGAAPASPTPPAAPALPTLSDDAAQLGILSKITGRMLAPPRALDQPQGLPMIDGSSSLRGTGGTGGMGGSSEASRRSTTGSATGSGPSRHATTPAQLSEIEQHVLDHLDARITARLDDELAQIIEDRVIRRVEDRLLDELTRRASSFTTGAF